MKFTIITPSFNQAEFLDRTIQSVVSQDYKNIEYLIFDAGSSDGSLEIIKKYATKYPKTIKYWSKKDKGQVDAINQGLKKATGDIIAYLNSDDYYLPGAFTKVVNFFKSDPESQWLVGNCRVTSPNLKWTFAIKHLVPIQSARSWLYLFNWINQPAVFLKKDLVNRVGEFNPKYHYAFDYDYWLRCQQFSLPGRLKTPLAVFRVHPNSKGSSGYQKQFQEQQQIATQNNLGCLPSLTHRLGKLVTITQYRRIK